MRNHMVATSSPAVSAGMAHEAHMEREAERAQRRRTTTTRVTIYRGRGPWEQRWHAKVRMASGRVVRAHAMAKGQLMLRIHRILYRSR